LKARAGGAIGIACLLAVFAQVLGPATGSAQAEPAATVTPARIEFGSQPVGIASPPRSVTLSNSGAAPLSITGVFASGIDFSLDNHCGATLEPGASCALEVSFKPAISGRRLGILVIASSDGASPHRVVLEGSGEQP